MNSKISCPKCGAVCPSLALECHYCQFKFYSTLSTRQYPTSPSFAPTLQEVYENAVPMSQYTTLKAKYDILITLTKKLADLCETRIGNNGNVDPMGAATIWQLSKIIKGTIKEFEEG